MRLYLKSDITEVLEENTEKHISDFLDRYEIKHTKMLN